MDGSSLPSDSGFLKVVYYAYITKEAHLKAVTRVAIEHARHAMKIRLGDFKNDKYTSVESRLEHKLVAASLADDSKRITEALQGFSPQLGKQSLTPVAREVSWQLWDTGRGLYRCDTFSSFVKQLLIDANHDRAKKSSSTKFCQSICCRRVSTQSRD